jgi:hypothetical protein
MASIEPHPVRPFPKEHFMALHRRLVRNALAAALALAAHSASAFEVTREFSGLWLDRNILGHGINVDIINGTQGKTAAVVWYTFGANGAPLWVAGSAPVTGTSFDVPVYTLSATVQPGPFGSAGGGEFHAFGTLHFDFSSCDTATVSYDPVDPQLANGTMSLQRGTQRFASQCTGGISDDKSTNAGDSEIEQFLTPVGNVGAGKARARFEQRSDRSEFSIELEDLPVGRYRLFVGGEDRGGLDVAAVTGGTQGETEFRSPVEPGKILLDFDPRGQIVDVRGAGGVLFSSTFGSGGSNGGGGSGTGNAPGTGDAYYLLKIEPSGNDGPELEAELEQRADRVEFSVEIEDVTPGDYVLRVAGVERGSVAVTMMPGGTHGETEFRNPVETGKLPLDFDPRGQLVEALHDGIVQFSGTFPSVANGPADDDNDDSSGDDDGSGDNGGDDDGSGDSGDGGAPGDISLLISLNGTGADGDANGEASFEQIGNEREFEVEIEDLADGAYTLKIGGIDRGQIPVSDERGELKFASPARAGRAMLDFDPRGQRIEIWRDGTRYLEGQLP